MKEREYHLKTQTFGNKIGTIKICLEGIHTWDWRHLEWKIRDAIFNETQFVLEPIRAIPFLTKTEEIQYLGQQLCASNEKDITRINSIAKRLTELANVELQKG